MPDQAPTDSTPTIESTPPTRYGTFTRRFRALVIDSAIVSGLVVALFLLDAAASGVPGSARLIWLLMFAVLLLYEPVLVSRRGATIGHMVTQLRVVDRRTGRWPSFARAFVRYLIKLVVGLPSFVTMALSRRHQAVHDLLTQTTVQVPASADAVEFHVERTEEPGVLLPSRLRRLVVTFLYLVALFVVYGVTLTAVDTAGCARDRSCAGGTRMLLDAIVLVYLALSIATIVAGWKGLLFGARRSWQPSSDVAVA